MDWIIAKFKGFWWGSERRPDPRPKPGATRERKSKDHFGAHYYLGDLLDTMDSAFKTFRALKKADPEAFRLYSKIGASIISKDGLFSSETHPMLKASEIPSFACLFLRGDDTDGSDDKRICPKFLYFIRENRPVNVQPTSNPVFRVGMIYSEKGMPDVAATFYIAVNAATDTYNLLKVLQPKEYLIPNGKRCDKFTRMEWRTPEFLHSIATDTPERVAEGMTAESFAREIFIIVCNAALTDESGITVRVNKGGLVCKFAIDMLRAPYFFADRDKVVNHNGRTKKILHVVRAHERKSNGGSKMIKMHFRGLREFIWDGYEVTIGMPGKHFRSLYEATMESYNEFADTKGRKVVTSPIMAGLLKRALEGKSINY